MCERGGYAVVSEPRRHSQGYKPSCKHIEVVVGVVKVVVAVVFVIVVVVVVVVKVEFVWQQ